MNYLVLIEKKGEGNYSASVPDLPGCVSNGESPSAVMKSIKEAINAHLKALHEQDKPIPVTATFFVGDVRVGDPRIGPAVFEHFITDLIEVDRRRSRDKVDRSSVELIKQLSRLPKLIEWICSGCQDLIGPEEVFKYKSTSGGPIDSLKYYLVEYVDDFISAVTFFDTYAPAQEAFPDDRPPLTTQTDPEQTIRQIATLILDKTALMTRNRFTPAQITYYFFWLSRAISMMLTHISTKDLRVVCDEKVYGVDAEGMEIN